MDSSNFLSECKFDTFNILATFYLVSHACELGIPLCGQADALNLHGASLCNLITMLL